MRLDLSTRRRVVLLKEAGMTYKEIQQRLAEEDITVTIKTLYLLVAKFRETKSVVDRPRGQPQKILSREHCRVIDEVLAQNDETNARALR